MGKYGIILLGLLAFSTRAFAAPTTTPAPTHKTITTTVETTDPATGAKTTRVTVETQAPPPAAPSGLLAAKPQFNMQDLIANYMLPGRDEAPADIDALLQKKIADNVATGACKKEDSQAGTSAKLADEISPIVTELGKIDKAITDLEGRRDKWQEAEAKKAQDAAAAKPADPNAAPAAAASPSPTPSAEKDPNDPTAIAADMKKELQRGIEQRKKLEALLDKLCSPADVEAMRKAFSQLGSMANHFDRLNKSMAKYAVKGDVTNGSGPEGSEPPGGSTPPSENAGTPQSTPNPMGNWANSGMGGMGNPSNNSQGDKNKLKPVEVAKPENKDSKNPFEALIANATNDKGFKDFLESYKGITGKKEGDASKTGGVGDLTSMLQGFAKTITDASAAKDRIQALVNSGTRARTPTRTSTAQRLSSRGTPVVSVQSQVNGATERAPAISRGR